MAGDKVVAGVWGAAAGVLPSGAAAVFVALVPALIVALLPAFPAAAAAAAAFFFPTTAAAAAGLITDSDAAGFCFFSSSSLVADLAAAAVADLSADLSAAGAGLVFLDGDGAAVEALALLACFFSGDDDGRLSLGGDDCACACFVRGPPPLRFLGAGPLAVLAGEGVFFPLLLLRGLLAAAVGGEGVFLPLLLLRGELRGLLRGVEASTSILSSLPLLTAFASRLAAAAEALRLREPAIVPCQLNFRHKMC